MKFHPVGLNIARAVLVVCLILGCSACGFSTLAIIPTLFARQSRLQGCPDNFQLLNSTVELTFVTVGEDGSTEAVGDEIMWTIRDGAAELDESANNPVLVTLTMVGVVTIRGDYNLPDENVNPAICTIFVQAGE